MVEKESGLPSLLRRCSRSERPIPGPAGKLQAEMHRRAVAVVPDGRVSPVVADEPDRDFRLPPWLHALESLDGTSSAMLVPINAIQAKKSANRVEQVMGIVSSCRPNGLGGLFITLKDPTGSIGAFIHHKVFAQENFCTAEFAVGSVLRLKQVVVFPVRATNYLNVTLKNLVKLISKDSIPRGYSSAATTTTGEQTEGELRKRGLTWEGVEKYNDVDCYCEDMDVELEAANRVRDVSTNHMASEDAIRIVKHKRLPDDKCSQVPNEIWRSTSSISAETIHAQQAKNAYSVLETAKFRASAIRQSANFINTTSSKELEYQRGKSPSRTSACSVISCKTTMSVETSGFKAGQVQVDKAMEATMCSSQNIGSTKGPHESLNCSKIVVPEAEMVIPKYGVQSTAPKVLVSKASVTEWTDEQLSELFLDYQDDNNLHELMF